MAAASKARLWNCSAEEYHTNKSYIGRSEFLDFLRSPSLYKRRHIDGVVPPKRQNPGMVLGSVFEAMVSDGSFRVTSSTFAERTTAVWKRVKTVPKSAKPLAYLVADGQFWETEDGVYRKAKAWGSIGSCTWTLNEDVERGKVATGFCRWTEFLSTKHFTPIPPHVLHRKSSTGTLERRGLPWDRFSEKHAGELLLMADEYEGLPAMLSQLRACEAASYVLNHSRLDQSKNTIVWIDADTGLQRKARIDLWPTDERMQWIADLKTTSEDSLRGFAYAVAKYGYDVQAVWYCDGFEALTGRRPEFVFVVANTQAENGYWVETLLLDDDFLERGRRRIDRGLKEMAECFESDRWLKRPHGKVVTLPMPQSIKYEDSWEFQPQDTE